MRIGHFNTYPHGGAAIAAARFHKEFTARRLDSRFYYLLNDREPPSDPTYSRIEFAPTPKWNAFSPIAAQSAKRRRRRTYQLYDRHLAQRDQQSPNFTMAVLPEPTRLNWDRTNLDVVHLHWVAHLADCPSFFASIPRSVPIVWTLHDMFPFTGGCHYSSGCKRFQLGCGSCGQINNPAPNDVSSHSWKAKQSAMKSRQFHVIAPSRWLHELASSSPIWPNNTLISHVRYGLDLRAYYPIAKSAARISLGIDPKALVIGFGADDITDQRKGFADLLTSLARVQSAKQIEAVVFGNGQTTNTPGLISRVHAMGYVSDAAQQAQVYSACDFVVVPSREDNQPSVALESMACGTPVVAYRAGGIAELVQEGSTGLLASPGNVNELAAAMQWMFENPQATRHMGERARLMMLRDFEITRQADRYLQIYEGMLAANRKSSRRAA